MVVLLPLGKDVCRTIAVEIVEAGCQKEKQWQQQNGSISFK